MGGGVTRGRGMRWRVTVGWRMQQAAALAALLPAIKEAFIRVHCKSSSDSDDHELQGGRLAWEESCMFQVERVPGQVSRAQTRLGSNGAAPCMAALRLAKG